MQRRSFAITIAAAAALGEVSLGAGAQETRSSIPHIGFLEAGSASANQHFSDAFQRGLRELGYLPGKTVHIDERWANGEAENFPRLLVELVQLRSDVIVVASTLGARAAKSVVKEVPVVFVGVSEPTESGLVKSLARPGENFTGLSRDFGEGLIGKTAQMLQSIVPRATRCALLWNTTGAVEPRLRQARSAVRTLGMTPLSIDVHDLAGFEPAFARMQSEHADALVVIADPLTLRHRQVVVDLAARTRIPAAYEFAEFARAGGLIAYSADVPALFERAASYVDKILKGVKAGDLPVEQPTKFELVINKRAAKALGLTIPQALLLRADEVIE